MAMKDRYTYLMGEAVGGSMNWPVSNAGQPASMVWTVPDALIYVLSNDLSGSFACRLASRAAYRQSFLHQMKKRWWLATKRLETYHVDQDPMELN